MTTVSVILEQNEVMLWF